MHTAFLSPAPLRKWRVSSRPAFAKSPPPLATTARQQRIILPSTSSSSSPLRSLSPYSAPSSTPHSPPPLPSNAVAYFAYFSNLNPLTLGPYSKFPFRRVTFLRTALATLRHHRLVFDVPGFPPEPAFANLRESYGSEVKGVLHWFKAAEFERVMRSEGVGFPGAGSRVEEIEVEVDSEIVRAKVVKFTNPLGRLVESTVRPSRRYVDTAINGAEYWGVEEQYVEGVLKKVQWEKGILGGFGLLLDQRPHLLDRLNPDMVGKR